MDADRIHEICRKISISTCKDTPERESFQIREGYFVFTITGNKDNWPNLMQAMGVPPNALRQETEDQVVFAWPSFADIVFGDDGLLAAEFPGYEKRMAQLYAGRLLQRGIEMGTPVVTELPTGTGKSLIYLLVVRAMGKRLIVSTSNRALQMQLFYKDGPQTAQLFPSKISLAQGKTNYICKLNEEHRRREDQRGEAKSALYFSPQYNDWICRTETGNIQEIDFEVDWAELPTVGDDCIKRHCPYYNECFYYRAKEERKNADIIICNHALTALNQRYPAAMILPDGPMLIVDEAHQLEQYIRNAHGAELTLKQVERLVFKLRDHLPEGEWQVLYYESAGTFQAIDDEEQDGAKWLTDADDIDRQAVTLYYAFEREVQTLMKGKQYETGIDTAYELTDGLILARTLRLAALAIWAPDQKPEDAHETKLENFAARVRKMALRLESVCALTPQGYVRWLTREEETIKLTAAPLDVSEWIALLAGFRTEPITVPDFTCCTRCGHKLTAETVHLLNGLPFGPTCIEYVDPFGDAETVSLQQWLATEHPATHEVKHEKTPMLLTSATLTTPTFAPILRAWGFPYALALKTDSPFNFQKHSLLYVPTKDAPDQNSSEYLAWLHDQMRQLVYASEGGAFLLFTSNKALNDATRALSTEFSQQFPVFVQGGLAKMEIVKRMRNLQNGVLFATKSFWEGVDIAGQALRLVTIDKLPFEAQTPFNLAQAEALREWARLNLKLDEGDLEWYPFNEISLPNMIIDLKQGAGRLIRTKEDKGVIAILDKRITTAYYARRKVLPALPPSPMTSDLAQVQKFFAALREGKPL